VSAPVDPPARSSRGIAIAIVTLAVLALIAMVIGRWWLRSDVPVDRSTEISATQPASTTTPEREVPATPDVPPSEPSTDKTAASPAAVAPVGDTRLVTAELCRNAPAGASRGEWRCDAVKDPIESGTLYFYTRVASPSDTTVEHRWYRGDRLLQSVQLRIAANPAGYRTFSRSTMSSDRAGDWKVEVRDQSGRLMDEKAFTVK